MKRNIDKLLLAAACLIPFLRLGIGEIQPWDESLYVIRAEACLKFGAWLDQTKYAVGGLYSAWHPPLGVWLISFSKYLLGNSTLSARLPIAIAASASIFILWLLIKRFASHEAELVAAISLATADLFLTYSHRAQMESLILFFSLASIYTLVKSIDKESWTLCIASGVLLGLGLLTKLGYAMYAAPFAVVLPWAIGKPRAIRFVCVMLAAALCISMPWFLMMINNHPGFVGYVRDYMQTFRTGNYAPSSLAWWYYLNRLIVALPLIAMCIFLRKPSRITIAALIWLLVTGLALQLVNTRMPHFAFLLLVPSAMLIGSAWDRLKIKSLRAKRSNPLKKSMFFFRNGLLRRPSGTPRNDVNDRPFHSFQIFILHPSSFILFLAVIGYSASEQVRLLLTGRLLWQEFIIQPGGIAAFGITIVLGIVAMKYAETKAKTAVGFSVLLLAIAFAHIFSVQEKVYENGAEQVAAIAENLTAKSRIVVIHPDFPHEQYAPQLAYYTGGWTLGWMPGKSSRTLSWDSAAKNDFLPDSASEFAVVTRFEDRFYKRPANETELWEKLSRKLRRSFSHEQVYRSYTFFY